jgi:hypothetical protein
MSTTGLVSSADRRYIVRPLDGENQVYENLPADATVRDLKERIFVAEGTPVEDQKLIYGASIMEGQFSSRNYSRSSPLSLAKQSSLQILGPSNPSTSVR